MTEPIRKHREIEQRLAELRRRIRSYVFVEGTCLLLAVLGLLFWASFLLDVAYFHWQRVELPRWFRAAFDVIVLGVVAGLLVTWVLARIFRSFRERALALLLERRFPELNDRLITAVELDQSLTGRETPLTLTMLQHTVDEAVRVLQRLDLSAVFEKRPLRRAVTMAVVVVASVVGFAAMNQTALARWKAGFLDLQDRYWDRHFGLVVRVVAQPGDQIKDFVEGPDEFEIKHARGGDLVLLVEGEEGKQIPPRVEIEYDLLGSRSTGYAVCTRGSDGAFRYTFAGLLEDVRFWVTGGDYRNRRPYRVRVVDPPRLDAVVFECRYPEYTGLQARRSDDDVTASAVAGPGRDSVLLNATQMSLPVETDFVLVGRANKPLRRVWIQYGPYELEFSAPGAAAKSGDSAASSEDWARVTVRNSAGEIERVIPVAAGRPRAFLADGAADAASSAGIPDSHTAGGEESGGATSFYVPFLLTSRAFGDAANGSAATSSDAAPKNGANSGPESPDSIAADDSAHGGRRDLAGSVIAADANAAIDAQAAPFGLPLRFVPDSRVRITLEDTDGIVSLEPERFTLNGIVDQPPAIESRLRGIGSSITRKARVPVTGWIRDDYGIERAFFTYQVAGEDSTKTAPFEYPPIGRPRELQLGVDPFADPPDDSAAEDALRRPAERFDVRALDLSIGDKVSIFVTAVDGDNINGPHEAMGERYTFQIVSNEELLSLLYQRELNQRQAFERIIEELQETKQDLILHRARLAERQRLQEDRAAGGAAAAHKAARPSGQGIAAAQPSSGAASVPVAAGAVLTRGQLVAQAEGGDSGPAAPTDGGEAGGETDSGKLDPASQIREIDVAVEACAERSLHAIRKNRTETSAIEEAFRDIREEMVNNAVDTPKLLSRIDDKILAPLHSANESDFPDLDLLLGELAYTVRNGGAPVDAFDNSIDAVDRLLVKFQQILGEMHRLETFQEAVELLKAIIKQEEELLEKTKKEKKKQDLRKLQGDLFK